MSFLDTTPSNISVSSGKVLQVKQLVVAKGTITTSSATFTSIGHSLAITPSATSSRILIQVCGGAGHAPYINQFCISTIYRGSTNLSTNGIETIGNSTAGLSAATHNIVFLDSPNTTSAVTYSLYAATSAGTFVAHRTWNSALVTNEPIMRIIAMEIEAGTSWS